jgi:2-dehydropantoate 2-reductase
MEPDEPARILVIGAGAIGAFYGGMLARTGAEVSVVRRSDAELVESRGFDIATPLGAFVFRPSRVLRSARDRAQAPDYVLLAVKTVRGLDRAALLRDTVGPGTVIALFGNGIGIQEIADAFPEHELISVLAFVAVSRSGATAISHHALGALAMGNSPRGISAATERLAQLSRRSAMRNPGRRDGGALAQESLEHRVQSDLGTPRHAGHACHLDARRGGAFVRRVMQEAAAASGYPIEPRVIDDTIASTRAMTPYKTSMALDHESGRPMEVEPILGNVVRGARRAAPRCRDALTGCALRLAAHGAGPQRIGHSLSWPTAGIHHRRTRRRGGRAS